LRGDVLRKRDGNGNEGRIYKADGSKKKFLGVGFSGLRQFRDTGTELFGSFGWDLSTPLRSRCLAWRIGVKLLVGQLVGRSTGWVGNIGWEFVTNCWLGWKNAVPGRFTFYKKDRE